MPLAEPHVCPACGCADFTQDRTCRVQFRVQVFDGYPDDMSEGEVLDNGERDEPLACEDCGAIYDVDGNELITEEAYNDGE